MRLVELGADVVADVLDRAQPGQPRAELLDRLELRRPGGHGLFVVDDRRPVVGQATEQGEVVIGPVVGGVVVQRQGARAARHSPESGATVRVLIPSQPRAEPSSPERGS